MQFRAFGSLSLSLSLSVPSFVFDGRLFCIHRILPSEFFRFLPSVLVCNESKIPRHCGTSNGLSLVSVAICGVSAVFGEKVSSCSPFFSRNFDVALHPVFSFQEQQSAQDKSGGFGAGFRSLTILLLLFLLLVLGNMPLRAL